MVVHWSCPVPVLLKHLYKSSSMTDSVSSYLDELGPVHSSGLSRVIQTAAVILQCKSMELFIHNLVVFPSSADPQLVENYRHLKRISGRSICMSFNGGGHIWWFEGGMKPTLPCHWLAYTVILGSQKSDHHEVIKEFAFVVSQPEVRYNAMNIPWVSLSCITEWIQRYLSLPTLCHSPMQEPRTCCFFHVVHVDTAL